MSASENNHVARKRRAYWITDAVSQKLRDRALMLAERGLDVQFFTSLETLIDELEERRAGIILISDDGGEALTERVLLTLTTMPEIQGARLVMIRSLRSERLDFLATCGNVRDIIPANLDDRQWLARLAFATAPRALPFVQPAGQITLNNISALSLPARMTWISEGRVRIESRLRPPVGATFSMTGPIAEAMGVPSLSLRVVERQRSQLLYRFSDAIIAEWSAPTVVADKAKAVLSDLKAQDVGPRCRVFVAIQSKSLRRAVLARFDDPRFDVATALQKQGIVDEPRYFTPDVVLIENQLCMSDGEERFHQMLGSLTDHATVIVLGSLPDLKDAQKRHPTRRIVQLSRIPGNISQSVLSRYLRAETQDAGACHLIAEHPYSLVNLTIPARLTRIHPMAAQIATSFELGNFALARLDSPLVRKMLGRNPHVKVTATYPDQRPDAGDFAYLADCYLADLDQDDRRGLAGGLQRLIVGSLARFDPIEVIPRADHRSGEVRTPELGSIKESAAAPVYAVPPPPAPRSMPPMRPMGDGNAAVALTAPEIDPLTLEDQRLIPTQQIAELVRPALSPMAEAAEGLKRSVARGVRKSVRKDHFKHAATAIAVIGAMTLMLWLAVKVFGSNYERSGAVYSDQLKKFAPHLNRPKP